MSKIAGITWPTDGKQIHQGDLQHEQDSISSEIVNRTLDIVGDGFVFGGVVSEGTDPGTVQITGVNGISVAYHDGQRILIPDTDNIAAGADGAKYLVARHLMVSNGVPNAQGYPIERNSNSYEILLKETLEDGDENTAHLTVVEGLVTQIIDQRSWCLPGSADRKFQVKNAAGANDAVPKSQMESAIADEATLRTNADAVLQNQISTLAAGIRVSTYEIKHCTNLDVSGFSGLTHDMDLGQSVTFGAGDIVASGFDMKLYTADSGVWTLLATLENHDAFFVIDTHIYYNTTPESAVDFLFNDNGDFIVLFDMPTLIPHASSHASGGSDPITPASIGAASAAGNSSQVFLVATATAANHAVTKTQLDTKAPAAGNSSQVFSVATATAANHAVTKTQLDTKENSSSSRLLPTGAVLDFTGKNSPSGFILASGRTIGNNGSGATERANADTLNLFTLYFDDYIDAELPMQNSSGSNTPRSTYATALLAFNALSRITIPDVRGRVTVGKDNMGTDANRITTAGCSIDGNTMLAAGGAQNHVLTTAQLAAHSHSTTVGDDSPDHSHQYSKSGFSAFNKVGGYDPYGVNVSTVSTAGASTRHSHSVTVNNTGSNQAHNNMQPSIIVLKIIKL